MASIDTSARHAATSTNQLQLGAHARQHARRGFDERAATTDIQHRHVLSWTQKRGLTPRRVLRPHTRGAAAIDRRD